jgi:3-hydroxy-9,10-secoandrosta-1,3,5(10)-triene-9,17-dione monooxygenase reductase component
MGDVSQPEPGARIHAGDPFATPEHARSPVRRLRGRLPAPVTLWTAGGPGGRAGLTVSSTLVADGDPARLLGLIDPEAEFWAEAERAGRFAVAALRSNHRQLADRFAGLLPAPGGLFGDAEWTDTEYGPMLPDVSSWAGCRLDGARPYGWALLIEATIERVELGDDRDPLVYFRGRYRTLTDR